MVLMETQGNSNKGHCSSVHLLSSRLMATLVLITMLLPLMAFSLREGDLLFVCSEDDNAITQVTTGVENLPIDHVGVAHRIGGERGPLFVIEAIKPAVCLTPIDTFLCHSSRVVVGRVNVEMDVHGSIRRCLAMVGKPYDDLYLPGDSAVYCSELVQLCYVTTAGNLVFNTVPMSFHETTGRVTQHWKDFYSTRGMQVPEGAPGTNPGELSRRPQVTIMGEISSCR